MMSVITKLKNRLGFKNEKQFVSVKKEEPELTGEQKRLHELAKVYLLNGKLPTDFSISLGAAPCNHSCLFCPQSIKKPKKALWLDLNILEKLLNEMPHKGVRLNISSYSETLAAPNLVPAVKLMKKIRPELPVTMATNGSLFREKIIEEILELEIDVYQYSFDAPDRESYARLMQVDHYEKTKKNLEKIIEIRDKKNSKTKILTHVMEFKETKTQNDEFIKEWSGILKGGDFTDIRRVANWGGGVWGITEQLKENGFTPIYEAPKNRFPCMSIFMHFKISPEGLYAPCVAAVPDSSHEEEWHKVEYLGHASEITWLEAWGKMLDMRKAHLEGRWNDYECCRTCNIWGLWENVWGMQTSASGEKPSYTIKDIEYVDNDVFEDKKQSEKLPV